MMLIFFILSSPFPCNSCHEDDTRNAPQKSLKLSETKVWTDNQCYGCHLELTAVAKNLKAGVKDKRLKNIFIPNDNLILYSSVHKLSYLSAPSFNANSYLHKKYSQQDIYDLVTHPPYWKDNKTVWQMPVHTRYKINAEPENGEECSSSKPRIASLCQTCHGKIKSKRNNAFSGIRMSYLKASYIFSYSNGFYHSEDRKMPRINITEKQSKKIKCYLISMRKRQSRLLKHAIKNIQTKVYLEGKSEEKDKFDLEDFYKLNHCSHCHTGEAYPSQYFQSTYKGTLKYIKSKGAKKLLERLIYRHLEKKYGVSYGEQPGMPTGFPPVAKKNIKEFSSWLNSLKL